MKTSTRTPTPQHAVQQADTTTPGAHQSLQQTRGGPERAFEAIGRVVEVSTATGTVVGRCRYGLQSVQLRVSVIDHGDGRSLIEIRAAADDVWGAGAEKGTDKLVAAFSALAVEKRDES